jgi:hypothetical protein
MHSIQWEFAAAPFHLIAGLAVLKNCDDDCKGHAMLVSALLAATRIGAELRS